MENYADFEYYTNTYKGAVLDTASFDLYARKATQEIKKYTFNRIQDSSIPDDAKMCCCELAEYLYKQDKYDTNVASEKVGEYSVSFVAGQTAEDIKLSAIKGIIYNWLAMTSLLYRGCDL